jgi:hypothetical protein
LSVEKTVRTDDQNYRISASSSKRSVESIGYGNIVMEKRGAIKHRGSNRVDNRKLNQN